MLPIIDPNNPPLDTALYFAKSCYSFYNIKQKGLYKFPLKENTDHVRTLSDVNETKNYLDINPKATFRLGRIHRSRFNKNAMKSRNEHYPLTHMKNKTFVLERRLFFQINKDNKEEEVRTMHFSKEKRFHKYSSKGLQDVERWGNNTIKKTTLKKNVFGRNKRNGECSIFQQYTEDSIKRLVNGDIKLYIPSKKEYMKSYLKNVIGDLLLESNTGTKYRKPIY